MSKTDVYNMNEAERWFASPYYSILYKERNESEAQDFVKVLLKHLNLADGAAVLDAACGNGRHCRALAAQGHKVTGLDLSPHNIEIAELKANKNQKKGDQLASN